MVDTMPFLIGDKKTMAQNPYSKGSAQWSAFNELVDGFDKKSSEALHFELTEERHMSNQWQGKNEDELLQHRDNVHAIEVVLLSRGEQI